jgi:ribose transport system substrate-binding protein
MKLRARYLIGAVAAAVVFAGCTPVQDQASGGDDGKTEGFTYGVSLYASGDTYAQAMIAAATDEAEKLGDSIIITTDGQFNAEKQGKDVQDIIARQPDAMLIAAGDTAQSKAWVDQAVEAGIPVFGLYNAIGNYGEPIYPGVSGAVQVDEKASGAAAGAIALQVLEESGGAAGVVLGQAGYAEVEDRLEGFTQALKDGGSDAQIYASPNGDWTSLHGQEACQDLIAAHPDITVIYSESDGMSVGCTQASNIGSVGVVGNAGSTEGLKLVESGGMLGTTCYGPGDIARQVVQMAHAQLAGDDSQKGKLILKAPASITADNVADCVQEW